MKTIVDNETKVSKYVFDDGVSVDPQSDKTITETFIIADLHRGNSTLYLGINVPNDWKAEKYVYDGSIWSLNPNWIDPETMGAQ